MTINVSEELAVCIFRTEMLSALQSVGTYSQNHKVSHSTTLYSSHSVLLESQMQHLIFIGLVKQRNRDAERDWAQLGKGQEYIHNIGDKNNGDGHLRNRADEGNILMGFADWAWSRFVQDHVHFTFYHDRLNCFLYVVE
jgi:hypothetical protein